MTKILLFANNKGGVGKTPAAFYTALRFAELGKKVSVFDLDGQCTLSDLIAPGVREGGIERVLDCPGRHAGMTLKQVLQPVVVGNHRVKLRLARASGELNDLEASLATGLGVMKLYNAMHDCDDLGDVVIIDTPPHLGALTSSAIVAAGMLRGWVIVPTRPEGASASGIDAIRREIEKASDALKFPNCLLGTIITMVRETKTHQSWLETLYSGFYPPVLGVTPLRGGELADYELRKLYAPIADTIWKMTGGEQNEQTL